MKSQVQTQSIWLIVKTLNTNILCSVVVFFLFLYIFFPLFWILLAVHYGNIPGPKLAQATSQMWAKYVSGWLICFSH